MNPNFQCFPLAINLMFSWRYRQLGDHHSCHMHLGLSNTLNTSSDKCSTPVVTLQSSYSTKPTKFCEPRHSLSMLSSTTASYEHDRGFFPLFA